MIREIINYTRDLIEDIPDIMRWKNIPKRGLYVFIDIDDDGNWTNQDLKFGKDYTFADGKSEDFELSDKCKDFDEVISPISWDTAGMNKLGSFDPNKKILACSPFGVAYKLKLNDKDKSRSKNATKLKKLSSKATKEQKEEYAKNLRIAKREFVERSISVYREKTIEKYSLTEKDIKIVNAFFDKFSCILDKIELLPKYSELTKDDDWIKIFIGNVPIEHQMDLHDDFLKEDIFLYKDETKKDKGPLSFLTTFSDEKVFLRHRTAPFINGISQRFSAEDALLLRKFDIIAKRKVFPSILPLVIDKRELNAEIVKIFKENNYKLEYKKIIEKLYNHSSHNTRQDYYLLCLSKIGMDLVINDFDFVPTFDYTVQGCVVESSKKDERPKIISTIFDLELLFNKLFPKYNKDEMSQYGFLIDNYFGDKVESSKPFKKYKIDNRVISTFYMYRKAIFDYIYKFKQESLCTRDIDNIAFAAILSDINYDEYKANHHSQYFNILEKINIWIGLTNYFNKNMEIKLSDYVEQIENITIGKSSISSKEDFAFAAGQLVSYLIDRSASSNKNYSLLEPYLQKVTSGALQDSIAQTIAIYKHDIKIMSNGRFENLASQVLTYDSKVQMQSLLKIFLAGCFCQCVIYKKNINN